MTTAETPKGIEIPSLVRKVMAQARQAAGSGTKFAARLKEFGVGPNDGYSESAISNWINGRVMPPADVLLAAAAIAGIPFGDDEDEPQQTQAEIEHESRTLIRLLQSQVDDLRLEVRILSDRIVIPLGPSNQPVGPPEGVLPTAGDAAPISGPDHPAVASKPERDQGEQPTARR